MFIEVAEAAARGIGVAASDEKSAGLAQKLAELFTTLLSSIPGWIAAFIVFILSIGIARMAKTAVENRIGSQIDEEHQEVLVVSGRMTYVMVLSIGVTVALKIAGIDLTTILAAVAFGLGFSLRIFITNFFAGVYILISRQFTIGDYIQIGKTIGKVQEIQSRATILKTYDGYKVIVPNAELYSKSVTSLTTNPMRRIKIPLYISYDTDIGYALKIALRIMRQHPRVLKKPKPTVVVKGYGDSYIELIARFWVGSKDGWYIIRSEVTHMLQEGLNAAGIYIPYKIVHLETNQDTAEEERSYQELQRKEKEKLAVGEVSPASAPQAAASKDGAELKSTAAANGISSPAAAAAPVEAVIPGMEEEESDMSG
ncbi:mechanosensitive ion channel [Candidatus Peregrinibacteria bacterium]|nr:mechanosensitive ion channel [Candidatus Peregrinibacteria bacterium]